MRKMLELLIIVWSRKKGFQAMTLRPVKHWKIQKIHKRAI